MNEQEMIYKTKIKWNKTPKSVNKLLQAVQPTFKNNYTQAKINSRLVESKLSALMISEAIHFIKSREEYTFTHTKWNYFDPYDYKVADEPNTRYGNMRHGGWVSLRGTASTYRDNQFSIKGIIEHALPLVTMFMVNLDDEKQKYGDNKYRNILGYMETALEQQENYFTKYSIPASRDDLAQAFKEYIDHLSKGGKYRNWDYPYDDRWNKLYEAHSHYLCIDTGDLLYLAEDNFTEKILNKYHSGGYILAEITNPIVMQEALTFIDRSIKLEQMKQGMSQTLKEFFDELKQMAQELTNEGDEQ